MIERSITIRVPDKFGKPIGKMPPVPQKFGKSISEATEERRQARITAARERTARERAEREAAEKLEREKRVAAAKAKAEAAKKARRANVRESLQTVFLGLIMIAITILIVLATLPINVQLFFNSWSRELIIQDAYDRGWTDSLSEHWENTLQSLESIEEGSWYGHFMANAHDLVQGVVGVLEFFITIILFVAGFLLIKDGFSSILFFKFEP